MLTGGSLNAVWWQLSASVLAFVVPVPGGAVPAALLAGLAAAAAMSSGPRLALRPPPADSGRNAARTSPAFALGVALLAGIGAWLFVGGWAGLIAGPVVGALAFRTLLRAEPAAVRREREQARRELPHLLGLLIAPLRAGASLEAALEASCRALPGPAANRFDEARRRLSLGVDPMLVWERLAHDAPTNSLGSGSSEPELAALGRALIRSAKTGASVVATLETLADELASRDRAAAEDAARQVGVRAALPLGLCLLPAFLLLGIVPVVAGLMAELTG